MRWNLKRTKLLFGLIPIIAIVFYLLTANNSIYADQTYVPIDINQAICDTLEPRQGSAPKDYSARENFAIAAGVLAQQQFYESTTTGKVVANIMNYTQNVANYKAVKGKAVFAESISLSTFASVAEQKYFNNGYIMYRRGNAKGNSVQSWPNSVSEMDSIVFAQRYGVIPREICKYSVTADSYIDGQLISSTDDTYTYKMELKAELAQKYARREIMTFANITQEPEFYTCFITYTITKDWRIQKIESEDYYQIAMMGGTKCRSSLTEEFSYDGDMPERAKIFIDYTPTGDNSDIVTEKGPAEYLQEAFGDYITGSKALYLTAKVDALGSTLDLKAALDIPNNDFTFSLGDKILLSYKGDKLYFKTGENRGKLSISALNDFMAKLGVDASTLTGIFDDPDLLAKLFENSEIVKTDTHVHIPMIFNMMGIGFNVDMALKIVDEKGTVAADSITAELDLSSLIGTETLVTAEVMLTDTLSMPAINDSDYTSYEPLLSAIGNTAKAKSFDLSALVNIQSDVINTAIALDAKIGIKDGTFTLDAALKLLGQTANLKYDGVTGFAQLGNIKLKSTLPELMQSVTTVADALSLNESGLSKIDLASLLPTVLSAVLPENPTLNDILDVICTMRYDGNALSIYTLPANGGQLTVSLTHDNEKLTGLTVSGFQIDGIKIGLEAKINRIAPVSEPVTVNDPDSYISVNELTAFVPAIKQLLDSKTYEFSVNTQIALSGVSVAVNGNVKLVRDGSNLNAEAEFFVDGKTDQRIYLAFVNGKVYVQAGDFKIMCDTANGISAVLDEIMVACKEYPGALPNMSADMAELLPALLSSLGFNGTDLESLVDGILKGITSLTLNQGVLTLDAAFGNLRFNASVEQREGVLTALTVNELNYTDGSNPLFSGYCKLSITALKPEADSVTVPDESGYLNAADFKQFIRPLFAALSARTYDFKLSLIMKDINSDRSENVTASVKLVRSENGLAVAGAITILNQNIDVMLKDNTIYLRLKNIMVKADLNNLDGLIEAIGTLLPDSGDLSATLAPILSEVLPKLDFAGITGLLGSLKISDGLLTLNVTPEKGAPYTVELAASPTALTGLTVKGLTVATYRINVEALLTTKTQSDKIDFAGGLTDADYLDIHEFVRFIPAVKQLINSQTYELNITGGALNTPIISGELSGKITVVRTSPLALQAKLKFRTHNVELSYIGETLYLKINDIRIQLKLTDVKDLSAQIKDIIPSFDADAIIGLIDSLIGSTSRPPYQSDGILDTLLGGADLDALLNTVVRLGLNEDGSLGITLGSGDLTVTVALNSNEDGIQFNITNLNYGTLLTDSYLNTFLSSYEQAENLTVMDESSYVNLADLSSYIRPVVETVQQDYFTINCNGSILNQTGSTTTIQAQLKVQPTAKFADIYLLLNLSGEGSNINLEATILDNRIYDENGNVTSGDIQAYVNYNGFKAQIDYKNVLKILGLAKDVLGLKIPMLDNLLEGAYVKQDTSVFDTMDIAGLSQLRDQINSMFEITDGLDGAQSAFDKVFSSLTGDVIDKVLSGVKLYYNKESSTLGITLNNGIFDKVNEGEKADIQITQDGNLLSAVSITNLIANNNRVNFSAELSCAPFEKISAPAEHTDYNSLGDLLSSVVTTASMREFQINGTIQLSIAGIFKPEIGANVKVKILDDGSTVAAIQLSVPYFFTALNQTESFIYFVNNRLYFVVDVYKDGAFAGSGYKRTETDSCTIEEFLADPMKYLFKLIQLDSFYKNMIPSMSGSSGGGSLNLKEIIKSYSYSNNTYNIKLGLAEIAGNSDLSDVNLTLETNQNYITKLNLDTEFVDVITLNLKDGARLNNIRYEDGKPVGANPITDVTLGHKFGAVESLDTLEDALANVFPIEAAEDFATKTDGYSAKAEKAAENADNSVNKANEATVNQDEAAKSLEKAEKALAEAEKGSFGYDILLSRASAARNAYKAAEAKREQAEKARITAASDAIAKANRLIGMVDKTASIAQTALSSATVRAYNAAGEAANSTILAIYTAQTALDSAKAAALASGNEALATQADAIRAKLDEITPAAAAKASETALTAGSMLIASARETAQAAVNAQNSGNALEALNKSGATLDAIAAMRTSAVAASYAAILSENAELIYRAEANALATASAESDCAANATNAAVYAAQTFAAQSRTAANNVKAMADNSDADGALNAIENVFELTANASKAVGYASKAVQIVADESLKQSADQASAVAKAAVTYVADTAAESMGKAALIKQAQAYTLVQSANSSVTLGNAMNALDAGDRAITHLKTAIAYNPTDENKATLSKVYTGKEQTALNFADKFVAAMLKATDTNTANVNSACSNAYKQRDAVKWAMSSFTPQLNAGNNLSSQINETAALAELITRYSSWNTTAFNEAAIANTNPDYAAYITVLNTIAGQESNTGLKYCLNAFVTSVNNTKAAGNALANKVRDHWTSLIVDHDDAITANDAAVANATTALEKKDAAQSSLGSLIELAAKFSNMLTGNR